MAEHDLNAVAFPKLSDEEVDRLVACTHGVLKQFHHGDTVVRVGQRIYSFFIVHSGQLNVVDTTGFEQKLIAVHRRGNFSGDVAHITGDPAPASLIAEGECELYEIERGDLKYALNQCPVISDIILSAFIARRQLLRSSPDFTGLRVIGSKYSPDTFRIRDFLARNRVLFTWSDIETDPQVDRLLKEFGMTEADTPIVACGHGLLLRNPSNRELADDIGIYRELSHELYDLVVVGAGPAGLAAAVYGASEGLRTVMLELTAPGGQAGSSMRIENYLGFPTGITGSDLAERAILQANKFGAKLSVPSSVSALEFDQAYPVVRLDDGDLGDTITAKCLLIATGAAYRKLNVEGCEEFEGAGVYYAASPREADMCAGRPVVVVGGGNSAGQAAVYLSQFAAKVSVLIRGADLSKSMSSYLIRRIDQTPNIELVCSTSVRKMCGNGHLSAIEIENVETGVVGELETEAVFSFIGADPRTDWLPAEIERDAKGFVRTGADLAELTGWTLKRQPFLLETSRPGVFAAGDVRSGSVKRIASAVGEGSMSVQFVHEYLKEL